MDLGLDASGACYKHQVVTLRCIFLAAADPVPSGVPDYFSWVEQGKVTPVKDQGNVSYKVTATAAWLPCLLACSWCLSLGLVFHTFKPLLVGQHAMFICGPPLGRVIQLTRPLACCCCSAAPAGPLQPQVMIAPLLLFHLALCSTT